MSNFPSLIAKQIIKILLQNGFELDRSKVSHHIYINRENGKRVIVTFHKKELPKGTMLSILKMAGIDKNKILK